MSKKKFEDINLFLKWFDDGLLSESKLSYSLLIYERESAVRIRLLDEKKNNDYDFMIMVVWGIKAITGIKLPYEGLKVSYLNDFKRRFLSSHGGCEDLQY